jgi:hypothetical protein
MIEPRRVLRLTAEQHERLRKHLFPGDGCEAVALALCGTRFTATQHVHCVHEILEIPVTACLVRSPTTVRWPVELGVELFAKAERRGMSILKIHSHPALFDSFSRLDDESDQALLAALATWSEASIEHLSAFMLPEGAIRARAVDSCGAMRMLNRVTVSGDELLMYSHDPEAVASDEADLRTRQAFGDGTTAVLKSLRIGIAGCSGTGSWVTEMLARLGVGHLVLVDPERIERKNLNRIINSTAKDVRVNTLKVEALARAIAAMGLGNVAEVVPEDLTKRRAIESLAACDVIFGCLDSADGRDLLNRISTYYCVPYIDVGVRLDADGSGGVNQVCAAIHYVLPGGSSLLTRGVITPTQVSAQALRRHDRQQYELLLKEGYIQGVPIDSPAVVSINGFAASQAVNELLARLHRFRSDDNAEYRYQLFSLRDGNWLRLPDGHPCNILRKKVGRGDCTPLLDNPLGQ